MFSPLKRFNAHKGGLKIGILGLGGLGQMGIKIAAAMGNSVTAISTRASKEPIARELGAVNFVVSTDPASMSGAAKSLDLILDTISANHQVMQDRQSGKMFGMLKYLIFDLSNKVGPYLTLLKKKGSHVFIGLTMEPHKVKRHQ